MFTWFSSSFFWVRIFLIILIWICSFGRDNCFYQCVAIVGSQFAFFYCPYKLPTPVFCKPWFSSQSLNKMTLLFRAFAHLPWFSFLRLQAWKLGFRSHIKIVTGLLWSFLSICPLRFQFTYRYTIDKTPRSLFIWHAYLLIWLRFTRLWWYSFNRVCDALVVWFI